MRNYLKPMRNYLKSLIKYSWRGVPVGIIASALIATVVIAAVILLSVTQTISQTISVRPDPVIVGEIIAPSIDLPEVYESTAFTWTAIAPVRVTTVAVDRTFRAVLDDVSATYGAFQVELVLASVPGGSTLTNEDVTVNLGDLDSILVLDAIGEYTFTQIITGTAGSFGTPSFALTLTLEE